MIRKRISVRALAIVFFLWYGQLTAGCQTEGRPVGEGPPCRASECLREGGPALCACASPWEL